MAKIAERLIFATSNAHKFREAHNFLKQHGIIIKQAPGKANEIRSEDVAEVARESAMQQSGKYKAAFFVEDSGLYIHSLNGFPCAYSKFALGKLGCSGILKLLSGCNNRKAEFRCSIAHCTGKSIRVFSGRCKGKISRTELGKSGFGFDPIFIPSGSKMTFAQDKIEKAKVSHRSKALSKLAEFINKK
ncbi:RdgB/HAM1 family non-canonical purine NTP pyrophosphatase [Candidatus Parvarchaeota archaeon]|nr:RdgB/HAM1 family non-canonical purine NTP pyrophosphatase [Candidatus Parvarchaeota archaeon]